MREILVFLAESAYLKRAGKLVETLRLRGTKELGVEKVKYQRKTKYLSLLIFNLQILLVFKSKILEPKFSNELMYFLING